MACPYNPQNNPYCTPTISGTNFRLSGIVNDDAAATDSLAMIGKSVMRSYPMVP